MTLFYVSVCIFGISFFSFAIDSQYEKRIRDFSGLEKVFDYFSSAEKVACDKSGHVGVGMLLGEGAPASLCLWCVCAMQDGVKCMTPQDLLAAIVPTYPSSQSDLERAGSLDGETQTCVHDCQPHQTAPSRLGSSVQCHG